MFAVLLQQAAADTEHAHHIGRCHDILPTLLINLLREVASDDITGSDSLQQLLRLLQTAQRQNSAGESVLVLKQFL